MISAVSKIDVPMGGVNTFTRPVRKKSGCNSKSH